MRAGKVGRVAWAAVVMAVAAVAMTPAASASSTSVVTDPVGDAIYAPGITGQAYQDIVEVSITLRHGQFTFVMDLAAPIPDSPPLLPPGVARLTWSWHLDTDPNTAPCGFPHAPGICANAEFFVYVLWDGTTFTGLLVDRRPLLTGEEAVLSPVSFTIEGSRITAFVDGAAIGDPSSFGWRSVAAIWAGPLGTESHLTLDNAPDQGFATWPS